MQLLRCQLGNSVRAFSADQRARLSTDVVQSDESKKKMPPFVFDDDDERAHLAWRHRLLPCIR